MALFVQNTQAYELYFGACVLDNLKFQAIYEDAGLTVTEDDVKEMLDAYGLDSTYYSSYEETYGKPYLYQTAMSYVVLKHLQSNVTVNE